MAAVAEAAGAKRAPAADVGETFGCGDSGWGRGDTETNGHARPPTREHSIMILESLLVPTAVVAIAEIGDKTQLLALLLAVRFRAPVPIIFGILVATLANHAVAAAVGTLVADWLSGDWFRWGLGASFLLMAGWALIPDKMDEDDAPKPSRFGPFLTTLVAFFFVEIGDKTQIATVALAARYDQIVMVTLGTTLGMMLANVPAVLVGEAAAKKVPLVWVRTGAALIFAVLGGVTLLWPVV